MNTVNTKRIIDQSACKKLLGYSSWYLKTERPALELAFVGKL
jgi:hypothetical protein